MKNKEEFETFVKNTRGERFLKRTKTSMRICGENRFFYVVFYSYIYTITN